MFVFRDLNTSRQTRWTSRKYWSLSFDLSQIHSQPHGWDQWLKCFGELQLRIQPTRLPRLLKAVVYLRVGAFLTTCDFLGRTSFNLAHIEVDAFYGGGGGGRDDGGKETQQI